MNQGAAEGLILTATTTVSYLSAVAGIGCYSSTAVDKGVFVYRTVRLWVRRCLCSDRLAGIGC